MVGLITQNGDDALPYPFESDVINDDAIARKIIWIVDRKPIMISKVESSGIASRQTIHTRIEGLIRKGYLRDEREAALPYKRYLFLTDKGIEGYERMKIHAWVNSHLHGLKEWASTFEEKNRRKIHR